MPNLGCCDAPHIHKKRRYGRDGQYVLNVAPVLSGVYTVHGSVSGQALDFRSGSFHANTVVMAYIVMACIVMDYVVMACIVMALCTWIPGIHQHSTHGCACTMSEHVCTQVNRVMT